jgi:hypothetical protein
MTPRPKVANPKSTIIMLRISDDVFTELQSIEVRDGVRVAEQVRRGIQLWLEAKGVKAPRKRGGSRPRG